MELKYKVEEKDVGKKYVSILKEKLNLSARLLIKLKNTRSIIFEDKPLYVNEIIKAEDVSKVIIVDLDKTDIEDDDRIEEVMNNTNRYDTIDIIYEDDGYICVNKPAFVAIHPSANHQGNTMLDYVKQYAYKNEKFKHKIHVVNRLDRETSGICIFAKHAYFQESIEILEKRYIAVVDGLVEGNGIIEKNIARKEGSIMERCILETGEYAKTGYTKISYNEEKNYTVLDVKLYTGRTHQIRVHFSSVDHSLLGDGLYNMSKNRNEYINRVALHSKKMVFFAKALNKKIEIVAPEPEDIKKLV